MVAVLLCSVGANPFDEDDDEEDFSNVVGVPVEALYDYVGQEDDELSFKKGIKVQNVTVEFVIYITIYQMPHEGWAHPIQSFRQVVYELKQCTESFEHFVFH